MGNPIAQTFNVFPQYAQGQDGVFLTQVDLFFQQADPLLGISVALCTTTNGAPNASVLPNSISYLPAASVNVSNNASIATSFKFPAPIFVKSGTQYAFIVTPDGNSPQYLIYTSALGQSDVLNPTYSVTSDWGEGVLFTSTNDTTWTPVQGENIKFTLYMANFSTSGGSLTLTNKDDEFFTVQKITGNMFHGEKVFRFSTASVTGAVAFSNSSYTVSGNGTAFLTAFANGGYIVLHNYRAPSILGKFSVHKVVSIANNTTLTLDTLPKFTANNVAALNTPVGILNYFSANTHEVELTNSTAANSTYCFYPYDIIISDQTGVQATIVSVNNKKISYFQPLIYRTNVTGTNITGNATLIDSTYTLNTTAPLTFNNSNYLNKFEAVIASKSLEIINGTGKSLNLPLALSSSYTTVSPTLDLQSSSILRYSNVINNDDARENTIAGNTVSRYVSKIVTLNTGLAAEDLQVYLTAYQPTGTTIEVYAKVESSNDPDSFVSKSWTKLSPIGPINYSDPTNRGDFQEYVYQFATTPTLVSIANSGISGSSSSANISGIGTLFSTNINAGDVVCVNNGPSFALLQVSTVNSNTSITLSGPPPWSFTGGSINKFADPHSVFKDPNNSNIATYFSNTASYNTFQTFAIKINLLSPYTYVVPTVHDLRAIALSI